MTKPSDLAHRKLQAVKEQHAAFWDEYGKSVDDVEQLHKHFMRIPGRDENAAAVLVLATIMNLEEEVP